MSLLSETRVPPHDSAAEEAVIGALLLSRPAIESVTPFLGAGDFYVPSHGHAYSAITGLYDKGSPVDVVTVADALDRAGVADLVGGSTLIHWQSNSPAISHVVEYAKIVKMHATARRALAEMAEATEAIYKLHDPYTVAEGLSLSLSELDRIGTVPKRFWQDIDLFLEMPESELGHWVIPGLCYSNTRVMMLASEKSGKSVALRQIAFCASQGIHPFRLTPMKPVKVMILDLENPDREIVTTGKQVRDMCKRSGPWDPTMISLFSRPFGFDLRSQKDRGELETALELFQPDLVVGGPIYKMMPAKDGESDPRHADAFTQIVGRMMERHGFALIIEHHAPIGGKVRELRATGGQRWPAWIDVTIALKAEGPKLVVEKPHPTRGVFDWPTELTRGRQGFEWPWLARYASREVPELAEPTEEDESW